MPSFFPGHQLFGQNLVHYNLLFPRLLLQLTPKHWVFVFSPGWQVVFLVQAILNWQILKPLGNHTLVFSGLSKLDVCQFLEIAQKEQGISEVSQVEGEVAEWQNYYHFYQNWHCYYPLDLLNFVYFIVQKHLLILIFSADQRANSFAKFIAFFLVEGILTSSG